MYGLREDYMDRAMEDETVAIAGERLNGIQEVSGSIPLISTNST